MVKVAALNAASFATATDWRLPEPERTRAFGTRARQPGSGLGSTRPVLRLQRDDVQLHRDLRRRLLEFVRSQGSAVA